MILAKKDEKMEQMDLPKNAPLHKITQFAIFLNNHVEFNTTDYNMLHNLDISIQLHKYKLDLAFYVFYNKFLAHIK